MSQNKTDRKRGPQGTTICPRCGIRQKEPNGAYCAECRRERQREWRQKRRESGILVRCTRCGKDFAAPGKTYCRACLAEVTRMRYRRQHPDRAVRAAIKPQPPKPQVVNLPAPDLSRKWSDAPSAFYALMIECASHRYVTENVIDLALFLECIEVDPKKRMLKCGAYKVHY